MAQVSTVALLGLAVLARLFEHGSAHKGARSLRDQAFELEISRSVVRSGPGVHAPSLARVYQYVAVGVKRLAVKTRHPAARAYAGRHRGVRRLLVAIRALKKQRG